MSLVALETLEEVGRGAPPVVFGALAIMIGVKTLALEHLLGGSVATSISDQLDVGLTAWAVISTLAWATGAIVRRCHS